MTRGCMLLCSVMVVLLSFSAIVAAEAAEGVSEANWGVGLGIPYGVLGVNVESGAQTRLSVGVGAALVGLGWNVGVKHYLSDPPTEDTGSASICLYYGTNAILGEKTWGVVDYDEVTEGFTVGLGWTAGHFDIAMLWPLGVDIPEGYEEEGAPVKLSIGYRF